MQHVVTCVMHADKYKDCYYGCAHTCELGRLIAQDEEALRVNVTEWNHGALHARLWKPSMLLNKVVA